MAIVRLSSCEQTAAGTAIAFGSSSPLRNSDGIRVTPHGLRRTFLIMLLRADMDALHLRAMPSPAGLEIVQHYTQMVDDGLLQSHGARSPVDSPARLV